MRPRELLGTTFTCECGRSHEIATKCLIYAEDALERLPEVLGSLVDGRSIVLVADRRTWDIAGRSAKESLEDAGFTTRQIIVSDAGGSSPVCDDITHNWLNKQLPDADIALAVGSGVINDLTKWSAFNHDMPYAVLATAATMNGFTAANVAPAVEGVKTIITARPPLAVFAIPSVIVEAPFELTASGLGDAIAKPVSTADWLLNHIFCDEYFCRYCSEIINELESCYLDRPEQIKNRQGPAIEALFNALLYSGMAMTMVGTSAPASGGEHLLSHTLDMMSAVDGIGHDLHGRQVGLGAIFSSALYDHILRIESPEAHRIRSDIDESFWAGLAGNVREQYRQKEPELRIISDKILEGETWSTFRDVAKKQVRHPREIKQCLKRAGAAHTLADIGSSRERLLDAVLHMHEIRRRPTIVDLAWMVGILPDAAGQIIDIWLTE